MRDYSGIESRRKEYISSHRKNLILQESAILSPSQCDNLLLLSGLSTTSHVSEMTSNRHSSYPTRDIPVKSLMQRIEPPEVELMSSILDTLKTTVAKFTGFFPTDLYFLDLFIVLYTVDGQPGLKLHTDGCLFSFNVLLNPPDEFTGGGTKFSTEPEVILKPSQGDLVLHDSKILHEGLPITSGKRILLVGFIETLRQSPGLKLIDSSIL